MSKANPGVITSPEFSQILSSLDPGFVLKQDLPQVDVVVCTYNSERYIRQCLQSIMDNIPVKNLWIVDKLSTDHTIEIATEFTYGIIYFSGSLAEARKKSFYLASTPLFVSVDSDVILCKDWFKKIYAKFLEQKTPTAIVWGITIDKNGLYGEYQKAFYSLKDPTKMTITHVPNMLVLKKAVEDIEFPSCLKAGSVAQEDYWIRKWVKHKGYAAITAPVFVDHYHSLDRLGKKVFWYGAGERAIGRTNFKRLLRSQLMSYIKAFVCGFKAKNARIIPFYIHYNINFLAGWLKWSKYLDLNRCEAPK